ncbi:MULTISPECIES: FecR family protein [Proteiniphilum]|uniref:FecR family protein n=4 Tax=Dysgonomonadaceae TaxID=2005520 RepID=UPI001EEB46BA|nr:MULTISPECIES: FecR family protein [Proteiniphilum]ULB34612.1 FecR domain-containing protein [Proteiniphilum propionicum]
MPTYIRYTDFLKDKQFIRWQLAPNRELEAHWEDFIKKNQHLNYELQQAIDYLKTNGLNKSTLNEDERLRLLNEIKSTVERSLKKTKHRRLIQLSVASCAAIALLIIGLNHFVFQEKETRFSPEQELIVGNLLNNEDIQLITDEDSLSFQNDVQVEFYESGKVKITHGNNEEKTAELTGSKQNTLIVPYGKRSTLTLSDGSKVWLNSGSVLEFPAQFGSKKREIRLTSGEMYIEVIPDSQKPFHVHTSDFNVKVYGTKFNVSAYADSPRSVVLVEGRVSLQPVNKKETFLSPSEQAVYSDNGTFNTQKVDVTQFISWKNGYLEFDKTPMTEVLKQIGRYYNLSFDFDNDVNLQKRTCTGKIFLSENLDNVMTTVGLLSSTKYIKDNNQVFIINEP